MFFVSIISINFDSFCELYILEFTTVISPTICFL
nr:MAG TPA: hypothetical protein [Caudoviricetes sp.]